VVEESTPVDAHAIEGMHSTTVTASMRKYPGEMNGTLVSPVQLKASPTGQSVHGIFGTSPKYPGAQTTQLSDEIEPSDIVEDPIHESQIKLPSLEEYFPFWQGEQSDCFRYFPGEQDEHEEEFAGDTLPKGHAVHEELPDWFWYVPDWQDKQNELEEDEE
jgi:hypothetical protein